MIKDFEKRIGQQGYHNIMAKLRMSTGLSYALLDNLIRQFANELADEIAISDTVIIPELGIFRVIRPDGVKHRIMFYPTRGVKEIYRNGGIEANKPLREKGILPPSAMTKYLNRDKEEK